MKWNGLVYGLLIAVLAASTCPAQQPAQSLPYQNPSLTPQERAKDLVSRLTLNEKASLMLDVPEAIPQFGIKKFNWWSEAPSFRSLC